MKEGDAFRKPSFASSHGQWNAVNNKKARVELSLYIYISINMVSFIPSMFTHPMGTSI